MLQKKSLWSPRVSSWDHYLGNPKLVGHGKSMVNAFRFRGKRKGWNTLITGESQSGKSSFVKLVMQSMGCYAITPQMLDPCGKCLNCRFKHHIHGNNDWEDVDIFLTSEDSQLPGAAWRYAFRFVDCSRVTASEIDDLALWSHQNSDKNQFVFLDEIHRLSRNHLDERLLIPMDECPITWIGASAMIKTATLEGGNGLDMMLQNRFSYRIETVKPPMNEMKQWLSVQCQLAGVAVEKGDATLEKLATSSGRIPGMAIELVEKAYNRDDERLTDAMIDEHVFCFDRA